MKHGSTFDVPLLKRQSGSKPDEVIEYDDICPDWLEHNSEQKTSSYIHTANKKQALNDNNPANGGEPVPV